MSKSSEMNWIDSSKKPRTFSEMREAFSQIRDMMSDWRQRQTGTTVVPDDDIKTRIANLSSMVEQMKTETSSRPYWLGETANISMENGHIAKAVPTGTIIYVCSHNAPDGYLKADGSPVFRKIYSELFSVIGVRFGSGDGILTFNLPDLRGEFIRGLDNGRGVDAGRELGNVQMDEFRSHYHGFLDRPNMRMESGVYTWTPQIMEVAEQDSISTTRSGGSETRPRNIALLACIKY